MSRICDNINNYHSNKIIGQNEEGIRTYCTRCHEVNVIRIGFDGRYNNREYARIFKEDLLQPGSNLYYKKHDKMSVI